VAGQAGLLPRASLGASLVAAAALGERLDLGVRARVFPEVDEGGDPSYAVGVALGTLELCAHAARPWRIAVAACGGASAGLVHASVLTGNRTQPGERAWFGAEIGLDATFPITRALVVVVGARGVAPAVRYRLAVEGSDAALFRQPAIAGLAHVGLELRFGEPR
jgi:hypothetical protein